MTAHYTNHTFGQLKLQGHIFLGSRSIRLLNYVGLIIMSGIALAVAYSVSSSYSRGEPLESTSFLYEISVFGFSFAQIFFGAAIIVFICAEWGSGFIYTTYGSSQRPIRFTLAKLFWPLVFAICSFSLTLLILIPLENSLIGTGTPYALSLTDLTVWRQIAIASFNLTSSVLFAAGLAIIFRHTASALGAYIAISIIAPMVFGLIPLDISQNISRWLPNNIYGYLISQDPMTVSGLNYPLLFLAAVTYPILTIALGTYLFKKQPV